MTVAELIEELRRMPPDRPVLIESLTGFDYETGIPNVDLESVDGLREDAAFAHKQPVVILSAAPWVR